MQFHVVREICKEDVRKYVKITARVHGEIFQPTIGSEGEEMNLKGLGKKNRELFYKEGIVVSQIYNDQETKGEKIQNNMKKEKVLTMARKQDMFKATVMIKTKDDVSRRIWRKKLRTGAGKQHTKSIKMEKQEMHKPKMSGMRLNSELSTGTSQISMIEKYERNEVEKRRTK